MKKLFINGKEAEFENESNLLEVIKKQGIEVPTLCYRPDLTKFGACRLCIVEIEGRGIQSSCTMPPEEGLNIFTNTPKLRKLRKIILELLIANHDRECLTCSKSGKCELQKYCEEYGVKHVRYAQRREVIPVDDSNPSLLRDQNKCILCGACVRACEEYQGHAVLGFANRGSKTHVQPMCNKNLSEVDCVFCGQCAAVCPTGAITIKSETERVFDAIADKERKVVAQIAPSVRVALGEEFGLKPGENSINLITAAMKMLGFDLVFDTNFSADVTIMEEGTEFLSRLKENKNLPIFTSCCPAWVRYMEMKHPDMLNHLSTTRSPQGIMGSIIREFVPKKFEGYTKENIFSVSIMPCTAKKAEATRWELFKDMKPNVDVVLTTQELAHMIRSAGIDFSKLKPVQADTPFGEYTGAGTIFGASGGVAEAACRTALEIASAKPLQSPDIKEMRGLNRSKEVTFDIDGNKIKVKIVNTLKEAEKAIQEVKSGKADYQMLEVMACPGGCINGGGQPQSCNNIEKRQMRADGLYQDDLQCEHRKSHENESVKALYKEWIGEPNSHLAHEFFHTSYSDKFAGSYQDIK